MKRVFTLMIFMLLVVLSASTESKAQQRVIFSQDFEYYGQINFSYPWKVETSVNAFPWRCDLAYLVFGVGIYFNNPSKLAIVVSRSASQGPDTNDLLITPAINLTGVQGAYLKYDSYFIGVQTGGASETGRVEITTNNGASWTILKNAPISSGANMTTSYVDLSAYDNMPSVKLGFRYSDSGRAMFGWMIDNIKVFVPGPHDLAITRTDPEDTLLGYSVSPGTVSLSGTVMNMGTSPVTAFDVNYSEGNGPVQTYTVSGLNIAAFDTLNFTHAVPYPMNSIGRHALKMWVSMPLDTNHTNDTALLVLHGAQFMPDKKVAVEEGTGTWHGYGPRGIVYMHMLAANDHPPTLITVHASDPMGNVVYKDYLFNLNQNYLPYFLMDRSKPVRYQELFQRYEVVRNHFGFADLNVKGSSTASTVSVTANVKPAIDITGDYRLALVVTEDGVTGTDTTYNQWNFYANNVLGPMGGYESKPNPVPAAQMQYDYVARTISPAPDGQTGCLPATMVAGNSYTCNLQASLTSGWKRNNLNVAVLLIRGSDSTVLNSKKVKLTALGVETIAQSGPELQVYPNPAGNTTTVDFTTVERTQITLIVTDITGRSVHNSPAGWMDIGRHTLNLQTAMWPSGVYFVMVQAGQKKEVVKLSVVR